MKSLRKLYSLDNKYANLSFNNLRINCRNFCIRERERERERQLQVTIKPKHTCAPIGRAIFK
jgi:hypothetical protein